MKRHDDRLTFSPSDLNAFLACAHLTSLQVRVAREELERPFRHNPFAELIRRKGDEHEAAYLQRLLDAGREVTTIGFDDQDWERAAAETEAAIRAGADVVYQACLRDPSGTWRGFADFVERLPSGTHEVVDTKLARRAKPAHVVQLCFYTEQLARIQERRPEHIHVVNGLSQRESFRPDDFLAYYRRLRSRFLRAVESHEPTYPYPVDHCSLCEFLALCKEQWERDDHLSLVAGIRRTQVERLDAAGVSTLAGLAATDEKVRKLRPETLAKLRRQAALQLHRRRTGELKHELLPLEENRGFALLPEPSPGDIWLDFEGDPWYEAARPLEYLTGWVCLGDDGEPRYEHLWSLDREQEKAGFERLIDLIRERRARHPGMHVYHYASYERTALQRLMGEHGTMENELDDLLRGEVLVDLLRVVRQALRLSLPSYSIKEVEAFYGFERGEEMGGGGGATVAFEEWLEARDDRILEEIRAYNEDDCRSLHELHRWLLGLRPAGLEWRRRPEEREVAEETRERLEERARVEAELLAGAEEGEPRRLLAHLLEYHRREEKPQWWSFFHNLEADPEELFESTECIGGLELAGGPEPDGQALVYTLGFPPQEHKIGGPCVDPATQKRLHVRVDDEHGLVTLRRARRRAEEPLPRALIPPEPLPTWVQRDAVLRFATARERYPALVEILERCAPRADLGGGVADAAASLDGGYLFVQGPPGSGKTWLGARAALELMRRGQRVGVTSLSHKAIHKFLEDLRGAALEAGLGFRGRKKSSGDPGSEYEDEFVDCSPSNEDMLDEELQLVAGTSFLFSRKELERRLDTLFVDEAGQVALSDVLAVGTAARNVVLLGDPNQLAQVSQGSHPPGAEASVLRHLLGSDETLRPEMGLFLEQTWRMRPEVNGFISDSFYDGRLESAGKTLERSLADGNGIRFLPVEHEGNRTQSQEEAEVVASEVERLVGSAFEVDGLRRELCYEDVIVVAPYNAHVRCLRDRLPREVAVGTVDRFQGQQAPVVFYAMGSSSSEDVPRGLDFLLSRNRLDVAISRAQCLAYLVCSPRLLDANCKTVEQMRLANALCRLVETAAPLQLP
ncbi:MAG TPA: TM0106 family RecB-like putative nuclease [Gaiellaceae bacterium]|nr:TM0106 family RecB-like putative nuclease [Gaiellaceae bacterium]